MAELSAREVLSSASRIVVKVGSVLVTDDQTGAARLDWLDSLATDLAVLIRQGKQVVMVSSGAVALGRRKLGVSSQISPTAIRLEHKQAAAAIGQIALSNAWHAVCARNGLTAAQVLLSPSDTENRRAHLNARATLLTLLDHGIVPVINENDTVATDELKFGDNDRLAARVAQMTGADALVILSTIDGLYTADPRQDPSARHVPFVEKIDASLSAMAGDALPGLSTGGMKSKLEAARMATMAGTHTLIASGQRPYPLKALTSETEPALATVFAADGKPSSARKRWIQAHVKPKGVLSVDAGAVSALRSGKSLLPAGVVRVSGTFEHGDPVTVETADGARLAIGLSAYSSAEASLIIGHRSADIPGLLDYAGPEEIIHRDDLVILG